MTLPMPRIPPQLAEAGEAEGCRVNFAADNHAELEAEATRCCRDDWCDRPSRDTFAKWSAIAAMLERCASNIRAENNRQQSLLVRYRRYA